MHYLEVVASSEIFLLALLSWAVLLIKTRMRLSSDDIHLAAVWLCALAISVVSAAKQGGGYNSLLSGMLLCAFVPMYCAARIDFSVSQRPWSVAGLGLLVAVLLLRTAAPSREYSIPLFQDRSADYREAVEHLRAMKSRNIVSPEDPVLLLLSGHEPGLNMYLEADRTIVSKPVIINQAIQDLYRATSAAEVPQTPQKIYSFMDYEAMFAGREHVVEVKQGFFGADYNLLNTDVLRALNFCKVWENASYAVWGAEGEK